MPVLLRRILWEMHGRYDIDVPHPIKGGKGGMVKNLQVLIGYALRERCDGILIIEDTDTESLSH